jgi:hypothetical protein
MYTESNSLLQKRMNSYCKVADPLISERQTGEQGAETNRALLLILTVKQPDNAEDIKQYCHPAAKG